MVRFTVVIVALAFAIFQAIAEDTPALNIVKSSIRLAHLPQGFGPVCSSRQQWTSPSVAERLRQVSKYAENLLTKDFPIWNQNLYLEFGLNGLRPNGERMMNARKSWLYPLTIAECLEGKGRFLPAIEHTINELINQPSWTWPAHDKWLRNLKGSNFHVDLLAADTVHDLSQALYMLGDWLNPDLRSQTLKVMNERVFEPVRKSISGENKENYWLNANDNWNAVCLKGVVAAALTVLPEIKDRALFAAAGEHYIKNYLSGFGPDGYTVEGPGYWNYGFSHFAILREVLMQHTGGTVDLFVNPNVPNIAMYGYSIEMLPNNIAAFGDASTKTRMDDFTRAYANEVLSLGQPHYLSNLKISAEQVGNDAPLAKAVLQLFANPQPVVGNFVNKIDIIGLQSFFESVGVLVSRPAPGGKLAVSIKAGGNGNHSHNDVGSYTVGLGVEQPTGDVGMTRYSAKTFSKDRYTIPGINSWGHPVPVVAGKQQLQSTTIKPRVISTKFSDSADEITINMADAYSVPSLRSLTRKMLHERANSGSITITDKFEFADPQAFEVAITTLGNWKQNPDGSIDLWQKKEHLTARIESSSPIVLKAENSNEEGLSFTRIGISLTNPQKNGYIKVLFKPALQ